MKKYVVRVTDDEEDKKDDEDKKYSRHKEGKNLYDIIGLRNGFILACNVDDEDARNLLKKEKYKIPYDKVRERVESIGKKVIGYWEGKQQPDSYILQTGFDKAIYYASNLYQYDFIHFNFDANYLLTAELYHSDNFKDYKKIEKTNKVLIGDVAKKRSGYSVIDNTAFSFALYDTDNKDEFAPEKWGDSLDRKGNRKMRKISYVCFDLEWQRGYDLDDPEGSYDWYMCNGWTQQGFKDYNDAKNYYFKHYNDADKHNFILLVYYVFDNNDVERRVEQLPELTSKSGLMQDGKTTAFCEDDISNRPKGIRDDEDFDSVKYLIDIIAKYSLDHIDTDKPKEVAHYLDELAIKSVRGRYITNEDDGTKHKIDAGFIYYFWYLIIERYFELKENA